MASSPTPSPAASSTMSRNVAGLLCYILGIITGVVFLVIEPYKNDKFVRFHAFQSIFFWLVCFVIWIVFAFVLAGLFIGMGGFTLWLPILWLIRLAMLAVWVFLMYKAYNNEEYKLPIIGDLAAKQAGA